MECNVSELVKRGHDKAAQLKSSCGAVSQLISDLATQLDVQLVRSNALAAENAGLKQFPDQIVVFIGKLGSSEIGSETKEKIEAAAKKIKTTATDAFLAEVRAQGADECVRKLVTSDDDDFSDAPNICAMVAYQLRKGVQS